MSSLLLQSVRLAARVWQKTVIIVEIRAASFLRKTARLRAIIQQYSPPVEKSQAEIESFQRLKPLAASFRPFPADMRRKAAAENICQRVLHQNAIFRAAARVFVIIAAGNAKSKTIIYFC